MTEHETNAADERAPKRRRRWMTRGGVATGGLASLAVGAVLGGLLEGVPVLLPHHNHSSALRVESRRGVQLPASIEDAAYTLPLRGPFRPRPSAPAAVLPSTTTASSGLRSPSVEPSVPASSTRPTPLPVSAPSAPVPSPVVAKPTTPITGAPAGQTQTPSGGTNPGTPPSDPVKTLVDNTVTTVNQTVGTVSSTVSTTVNQTVGTVVSTVPPPVGSPGTTTSSPSGGTTLTSPVSTVTSTLSSGTPGL